MIGNGISIFKGIRSSGSSPAFNYEGFFIPKLGQSNWTPRFNKTGNLPSPQQAVLTGVYNYSYNGGSPAFTPFQSSVNDNWGADIYLPASGGGVGPYKDFNNVANTFCMGNSLAYKMYNTYNKQTYFVPCSLGGTALDVLGLSEYSAATWDSNTVDSLYTNAITQITDAWNAAKLAGKNLYPIIIWNQGENDAADLTMANNYRTNIGVFEADLRADLTALDPLFATCPFIVTSLRADSSLTYHDTVQRAQVDFVANTSNAYLHYMFKDATPLSSDGQHYTPIVDNYVGVMGAINAGEELADLIYRLKINPFVDNGYISVIGGDKITAGDYNYYDFKTHGILETFIVPVGKTIDNLILVGGGGSGGSGGGTSAGGGAGGGKNVQVNYSISVSKKSIYIGLGGQATIDAGGSAYYQGYTGENTTFDVLTALGGGGGGGYSVDGLNGKNNGLNGGNGGGAASYLIAGTAGTGTFNGGAAFTHPGQAGGGGGAGEAGENGTLTKGGDGGDGYLWVDGVYYGGGGGASSLIGVTAGSGGLGGGGNGQERNATLAVAGTDYLGGGGGSISASAGIGGLGEPVPGGIGRAKFKIKFQN